jgi:Lon protease-like protein
MTHQTESPFAIDASQLPSDIAIFPLNGATLLPGAKLSLNIFEPRYLNMALDALGKQRLIGMIQPDRSRSDVEHVAVYPVGCAGRIVSFSETDDGRLMITLAGVCRFRVTEELPIQRGYRRIMADWSGYLNDMEPASTTGVNAERVLALATQYLRAHELDANLDTLRTMPAALLTNALAVHLPFDTTQKQALLEAQSVDHRAEMLMALCELDSNDDASTPVVRH